MLLTITDRQHGYTQMINSTVRIELRGMYRYHETVIEGFARFIGDVAEDGRTEIRDSWSDVSPSSPGQPPAVVTGFLDSSIEADKSQLKSFTAYIRANAEYSLPLEFGTHKMAARPFMRPWLHQQEDAKLAAKFKAGGYVK